MLNQLRSLLFKLQSFLGDVNAIQRGAIGKRLVRKYAMRSVNGALRKLLK